MNISAIITYLSIMSITPGPSNLISLYLGAQSGFKGAFKFILGSNIGLFIKCIICGLLNIMLAQKVPSLVPYLKWLGIIYMFYLAYSIIKSGIKKDNIEGKDGHSNIKSGLLLQVVNIKSWVACLSLYSVYVTPFTMQSIDIIFVAFLFFFISITASFLWGSFGVAIKNIYQKYRLLVSIVLALSLIYVAIR